MTAHPSGPLDALGRQCLTRARRALDSFRAPRDQAARPMPSPLHILAPSKPGALTASSALGRFVDRLLQTFEDCRSGLTDETLSKGEKAVEQYFLEIYARETERLEETIRDQPLLTDSSKAKLRA